MAFADDVLGRAFALRLRREESPDTAGQDSS